jgi:hypothetical protein
MLGEEYKIKIGEYKGKELKNIPPGYLISMFDKGYLHWDKPAYRFVSNNYEELKKLIK